MSEGSFQAPQAVAAGVVTPQTMKKAPVPTSPGTVTLPATRLKSPAGIDLIQGFRKSGNCYFVIQAEGNGPLQDIYVSRFDNNLNYKGYISIPGAGHGSSCGIIPLDSDSWLIVIGHATLGIIGVTYNVGKKTEIVRYPGARRGNPCLNSDANLLGITSGTTVTIYPWDQIRAGNKRVTPLHEFKIIKKAGWRFQGAALYNGFYYVHWDSGSGSRGFVHKYNMDGKLVSKLNPSTQGEPEGFSLQDGALWVSERRGGLNNRRTIVMTRVRG